MKLRGLARGLGVLLLLIIRINRCSSQGFPFEKLGDRDKYKRNHECKY